MYEGTQNVYACGNVIFGSFSDVKKHVADVHDIKDEAEKQNQLHRQLQVKFLIS